MTIPRIDRLFHEYTGTVPGAGALLAQDGVIQLSAAFGPLMSPYRARTKNEVFFRIWYDR
jgi:hypothetical protein